MNAESQYNSSSAQCEIRTENLMFAGSRETLEKTNIQRFSRFSHTGKKATNKNSNITEPISINVLPHLKQV